MATEYRQFTELCAEYQKRIRDGYSVSDIKIITMEEKK